MPRRNFVPVPGEQANRRVGRGEGITIAKADACAAPYHLSMRDKHVTGGTRIAPILVEGGGAVPHACPLGFSVPNKVPQTEIITGGTHLALNIQVAVRKYRSTDGAASDISPVYPPEDSLVIGTDATNVSNENSGSVVDVTVLGVGSGAGFFGRVGQLFFAPARQLGADFDQSELTAWHTANPNPTPIFVKSLRIRAKRSNTTFTGSMEVGLYDVTNNTSISGSKTPSALLDGAVGSFVISDLGTSDFQDVTIEFPRIVQLLPGRFYAVAVGNPGFAYDGTDSVTIEARGPVGSAILSRDGGARSFDGVGTSFSRVSQKFKGAAKILKYGASSSSKVFSIVDSRMDFTGSVSSGDQDLRIVGAPPAHAIVDASGVTGADAEGGEFSLRYNDSSTNPDPISGPSTSFSDFGAVLAFDGIPLNDGSAILGIYFDVDNSKALSTTDPTNQIADYDQIATSISANQYVNGAAHVSSGTTFLVAFTGSTPRIFKTTDTGGTWASSVTGLSGTDGVTAFGEDRANANRYYCAQEDQNVYYTTDGGANWSAYSAQPSLSVGETITWITHCGTDALYVATSGGRILSADDRTASSPTWSVVSLTGLPSATQIDRLEMPAATAAELYAQVDGAVYYSADSGAGFQSILDVDFIRAWDISPDSSAGLIYSRSTLQAGVDNNLVLNIRVRGYTGYKIFKVQARDAYQRRLGFSYALSQWTTGGEPIKLFFDLVPPPKGAVQGGDAVSRFSDKFLALASGKGLRVSNLADYASDSRFEDFDKLQVLMASDEFLGEWRVIDEVDLEDQTWEWSGPPGGGGMNEYDNAQVVLPFQNWPFGGHNSMIALKVGESQALFAQGLPGWDNYTDAPVVEQTGVNYLVRFDDSGVTRWALGNYDGGWESGLSGIADPSSLDGYLVSAFKGDPLDYVTIQGRSIPKGGRPIFTGRLSWNVSDSYLEIVDPKGEIFQVSAGTPVGASGSGVRVEFRREVLATVAKGKNTVTFTYADDGSAANIADRWMVNHALRVEGIDGFGTVLRVDPKTAEDTSAIFPRGFFPSNQLQLITPWNAEGGTGQFSLSREDNVFFLGGDRADNWQGTSPKFRLETNNSQPVVGIGFVKGQLVAVCSHDEIIAFSISRIALPSTLEGFIGYDLSQDVRSEIRRYSFSCLSRASFVVDDYGNLYWVGANGIYAYNLQSTNLITAGRIGETFKKINPETLITARAVADPSYPFGHAIRFVGMALKGRAADNLLGAYRTTASATDTWRQHTRDSFADASKTWHVCVPRQNQNLVFNPERESWLHLPGIEASAITKVVTVDGGVRVLFGANGFLHLVAPPAGIDGTRTEDAYTNARINRESISITSFPGSQFVSGSTPTVTFRTSDFTRYTDFDPFQLSGQTLTVIDSTGAWKQAEILFPTATPIALDDDKLVTFRIQHLDGNSSIVSSGENYSLIIGARKFRLDTPKLFPTGRSRRVHPERLLIDVEDNDTSFAWPLKWSVLASGGYASNQSAETVSRYISQSDRDELRYGGWRIMAEGSREFFFRLEGIAPPDASPVFHEIRVDYHEEG